MAPLAAMLTFLKMEVLSQLASGLVAKHVNKKMLANHDYVHLLLLLQLSVLWLSIVTFNNYVKPPGAKVNCVRILCITNPTPTILGYLDTLKP